MFAGGVYASVLGGVYVSVLAQNACLSVCTPTDTDIIDLVYGKRGLPIRQCVGVQTDAVDTHA